MKEDGKEKSVKEINNEFTIQPPMSILQYWKYLEDFNDCRHFLISFLLTQTFLSRVFSKVKSKLIKIFEFCWILQLLFQSWQQSFQLFCGVTPVQERLHYLHTFKISSYFSPTSSMVQFKSKTKQWLRQNQIIFVHSIMKYINAHVPLLKNFKWNIVYRHPLGTECKQDSLV